MHQLHVMLSDKDHTHLKEQIRRSGLSTSAFIRALILGTEVKERPTEAVIQVCKELNAIGNNLNQLTWAANCGAPVSTEQLADIHKDLERLWFWIKLDSELMEPHERT